MDEKRITVKSTEKKWSAKAKKNYLVVEATDGAKYCLWAQHDLWDVIEPGFELRLAGEQKGEFFNVEAAHLELNQTPKEPQSHPSISQEKQYKADPDKLDLSRRSYALSYAKDLAVVDRIKVSEILERAVMFDAFLGGDVAVETTASAVKKTAAKSKPKDEPEEDLFTEGDLPPAAPSGIDEDWLTESLKSLKWNQTTFKSWLKSKFQTDDVGQLDQEQKETLVKEIQERLDLKGI